MTAFVDIVASSLITDVIPTEVGGGFPVTQWRNLIRYETATHPSVTKNCNPIEPGLLRFLGSGPKPADLRSK